jgi:hypothetical protein
VLKFAVMWGLALGWFVALAYLAVDAFTESAPLLSSGRLRWMLEIFAGIGALTAGLLPIVAAATVQVIRGRRLRTRLEKQRAKIDKQLARLDERQDRKARPALRPAPDPAPAPAPAPAPGPAARPEHSYEHRPESDAGAQR